MASLSAAPRESPAPHARLVVERYSVEQTGVTGQPRVIRQLSDGKIAIGADRGLYLYDGERWLVVPGHSGVSSVLPMPDGRFYVGSGGEVFELRPNGRGGYTSTPLSGGLLRDQPHSIVFGLALHEGVLYGLDGERLLRLAPGEPPAVLTLPQPATGVFVAGGAVYLRGRDAPETLWLYDAAQNRIAPATERLPRELREPLVAHTQGADEGTVVLATANGHFFSFDGAAAVRLPGRLGGPDHTYRIHAIERLPAGGLAVATVERGVLMLNAAGEVWPRPLSDNADVDRRTYAMGLDRDGGLWLGGALELTRLDGWLRSWVYGEREGLVGEVWATLRHRGRLYVGTDAGLFVENSRHSAVPTGFSAIAGIPPVKALVSSADGLWISGDRLQLLMNNGALRTFGSEIRDANPLVLPWRRPDVLFVGVADGLRMMRRVARTWEDGGLVPGIAHQVFALAETQSGDIWAALGTGMVARVRWHGESLAVQLFSAAAGIPNVWVQPGVLGDDVFVGGGGQTLQWNEATQQFVPSSTLQYYGGEEPFGFDPVFRAPGGEAYIWPQTTLATLMPRPEAGSLAAMATVTGHVRARSRSAFYDADGVVWIGLPNGLLRYVPAPPRAEPPPARVHLHRLIDVRTGEALIGGVSGNARLKLPRGRDSFRAEVNLPRFGGERFAQYAIELRGFDEQPPWFGSRAHREFTRLPPGGYTLVLHAADGAGRVVPPTELAFTVQAPLYATPGAVLMYTVLGAVSLVGLVRWRLAHLRRQASELQQAVAERTVELSRQSALLQAEKELVASIAAAAPVGIWHGDTQGGVWLVNATLETIGGRSRETLLAEGWLTGVHAEDRPRAERMMQEATHDGQPRSAELRWQRPAGEVRWVIVSVAPVRAGEAGGADIVGTALDVTERREDERRATRAQRLESLGTLTGGIAHDLNNALVPIIAGLSLLEESAHGERDVLLGDIDRSAKRAAAMVCQLLAFARGMDGQRHPVELSALLRELERLLQRTFPKSITLRSDWVERAAWVQADPTQLHQVLLNLCVNARDAMANGGTLHLRLATARVEGVQDAFQEPIAPGLYRVVTVQDTGTGMPPDVLEHIFDPFFTTKEPERGTGLGLSTSLGIVRSHRGYIAVDTQQGTGTTFSIYLPAIEAPAEVAVGSPLHPRLAGTALPGTALVVDDEAVIRSVLQRSLARLQVEVITAADGAEGLKQWREHRAAIGFAVIDVNMPVMDGVALVRALRTEAPALPIIVSSGNLSEEHRRELQTLEVRTLLPKPFLFDQLVEAVRTVLQR